MSAPLRREVLVSISPDRAFALFTDRIGDWWPLSRHGVFGDGTVAFEDGRIVERSKGRESVWGEVTTWEPPGALAFTWHPGYGSEHATHVLVTFEASGERTLVTLAHTGWERMTDPEAARQEYGNGWPGVLAGFSAHAEVAAHSVREEQLPADPEQDEGGDEAAEHHEHDRTLAPDDRDDPENHPDPADDEDRGRG